MSPERNHINKNDKGSSVEDCLTKANEFISKNGLCLFLFDVKGSKKYKNHQMFQEELLSLITSLNLEFEQYFPENNLMVATRTEQGFSHLFGDGSWAAINHPEAVERIIEYIHQKMPLTEFYFDVAQDGFDSSNINILK